MKSAITNYDQVFYIDQTAFSGILNVNGSYSLSYAPINTIGVGYNKQVITEIPVGELSLSKYLLYEEPFLKYTGENLSKQAIPINGSLNYGSKSIGFQAGYLNSFELSCSVGEVPQTDVSISIYGDFGNGISASGPNSSPYITVPQVKDISLTCSGSTTNRINNFSYKISCPKSPIYSLSDNNSYIPVEVLSKMPIEVTADFTLEVDDYETKRMYEMITLNDSFNFSIDIKGRVFVNILYSYNGSALILNSNEHAYAISQSGIRIFSANINNASLISQSFNSDTEGFLSVNLSYRAYLMN
jgi:hypothetical protein